VIEGARTQRPGLLEHPAQRKAEGGRVLAQGSPVEGGRRPIGYRKVLAVVLAAERVCDAWCEFDKLLQVQSLGTLKGTSRLGGLRRSHGERSL